MQPPGIRATTSSIAFIRLERWCHLHMLPSAAASYTSAGGPGRPDPWASDRERARAENISGADALAEHVLRGSKSFAARSFRSCPLAHSLRAPTSQEVASPGRHRREQRRCNPRMQASRKLSPLGHDWLESSDVLHPSPYPIPYPTADHA